MIYLSIGHHAFAQGAEHNGITEYKEAQRWCEMIYSMLIDRHLGICAVPPGKLSSKVNFINNNIQSFPTKTNDIAIEMHFNSEPTRTAIGSETLYHPKSQKGKPFAEMVQAEFKARDVFQPDRGVKEGWYYEGGTNTRKLLYFLRKTMCPAVIIEPDFIYNWEYINEYRIEGCKAIVDAIAKYKHEQETITNNR